jgi:hypothetical protein
MREIRSYGSVRGVRSNPYPYRDSPTPGAEGTAPPPLSRHCSFASGTIAASSPPNLALLTILEPQLVQPRFKLGPLPCFTHDLAQPTPFRL